MFWITLIVITSFIAGIAVARCNREDDACNAFADAVIAVLTIPIEIVKSRMTTKEQEPPKSRKKTIIQTETEEVMERR